MFDVSQTDGAPLPSLARASGNPHDDIRLLELVYSNLGIDLEIADLPKGCFGTSRGGHVQIASHLDAAETFHTMVHELAHEQLHSTTCKDRACVSKHVQELEAESVAFVVSQAHGVECKEATRDYIQLYQGDEQLLAVSLERIQKTAVSILNFISEVKEGRDALEVSHAA